MSSGEGEDTSKEAADIAAFFKSGKWRRREGRAVRCFRDDEPADPDPGSRQ